LGDPRNLDWYGGDFSQGFRGYESLEDFFAAYADALTDDAALREKIRATQAGIDFREYDWRVDDTRTSSR